MTLKKSKINGQSALEYFILTIVVIMILLFFTKSPMFDGVKGGMDKLLNESINRITAK